MRVQPPRLCKQSPAPEATLSASGGAGPTRKTNTTKLRMPKKPQSILRNPRVANSAPKRNVGFSGVDEIRDFYTHDDPAKARVVAEVAAALHVVRRAGISLQDSGRLTQALADYGEERALRFAAQRELATVTQQLARARKSLANTVPLRRLEALEDELARHPSLSDWEALKRDHELLCGEKMALQQTVEEHVSGLAAVSAERDALIQQVAELQQNHWMPFSNSPDDPHFGSSTPDVFDDEIDLRLWKALGNA